MIGKLLMKWLAGGTSKNDVKDHIKDSAETKTNKFNFHALPEDVKKSIGMEWFRFEEMVGVERKNALYSEQNSVKPMLLFKPTLTELEAAYYVLTGRPEHLLRALAKKPDLFFKPCIQINDAAGQIFHHVSPADLIDFVCDDEMQNQVAIFSATLPEEKKQLFINKWETQRASRGRGGADLVKLAHDPMTQPFKAVLESTQTYNISDVPDEVTYSLLKNPDGILYYLDANKKEHWYYANKDNETIEPIEIPVELLTQYQDAYDQLKLDMDSMEPDSATRSSNKTHLLIQTLMRHSTTKKPVQLVREGIHYTRDGIEYRDTHYDFNRMYNVYRKCIRSEASGFEGCYNRAWLVEHAHRIREVMCVVQRLCEANPSFYDADFSAPTLGEFKRIFSVTNRYNKVVDVFDSKAGVFLRQFGLYSDYGFSIYKGEGLNSFPDVPDGKYHYGVDLVAVHRRMENAKKNVDEFKPNQVLSRGLTL